MRSLVVALVAALVLAGCSSTPTASKSTTKATKASTSGPRTTSLAVTSDAPTSVALARPADASWVEQAGLPGAAPATEPFAPLACDPDGPAARMRELPGWADRNATLAAVLAVLGLGLRNATSLGGNDWQWELTGGGTANAFGDTLSFLLPNGLMPTTDTDAAKDVLHRIAAALHAPAKAHLVGNVTPVQQDIGFGQAWYVEGVVLQTVNGTAVRTVASFSAPQPSGTSMFVLPPLDLGSTVPLAGATMQLEDRGTEAVKCAYNWTAAAPEGVLVLNSQGGRLVFTMAVVRTEAVPAGSASRATVVFDAVTGAILATYTTVAASPTQG
jgi:hypothetical protein